MAGNTNYSERGFWSKFRHYAKTAGSKVVELALQLYYAAQDPETPAWAKTIIYGALGYLILPVDAIPDMVPVAGYSDDLGALAAAGAMVAMYITPEVKEQAKKKPKDWFG